ncbi:hypothetical protein IWQ57_006496 [Coemansia nantahalensis]|uniref:Uncharacterized protein n=1 Tax=Coemansia nantahalensis TaxID=2789366 RepID=A0ACC1JJK0_9FUNG|nr:hypothetical protein IWQ57_006496 [Coemansia nantahalensis]
MADSAGRASGGGAAATESEPPAHLTIDTSVQDTAVATSATHPLIFRHGTEVEIPEEPIKSARLRELRQGRVPAHKRRLVAICIVDDEQAESLTSWALQNELVLGRDSVLLLHVRQSASGMLGDLIGTNGTAESADRTWSHALLRKHAIPLKREGFAIKGVSIKGADIRGELVCKLVEFGCDLVVVGGGHHKRRSILDRLRRRKSVHLLDKAPCPVLFVRPAPGRAGSEK